MRPVLVKFSHSSLIVVIVLTALTLTSHTASHMRRRLCACTVVFVRAPSSSCVHRRYFASSLLCARRRRLCAPSFRRFSHTSGSLSRGVPSRLSPHVRREDLFLLTFSFRGRFATDFSIAPSALSRLALLALSLRSRFLHLISLIPTRPFLTITFDPKVATF
uniref:Putative secreted protein n=1 Tax=Anopheles marajoara TaxID=58244 RepID=A0A2M4C6C9_9DIPT